MSIQSVELMIKELAQKLEVAEEHAWSWLKQELQKVLHRSETDASAVKAEVSPTEGA